MALRVALRTSLTKCLSAFVDVTFNATGVVAVVVCAQAPNTTRLVTRKTALVRFILAPCERWPNVRLAISSHPETIATHTAYQEQPHLRRAIAPSTPREQTSSSSTRPG